MTPDERQLLNNHISMIHAINNEPPDAFDYAESVEKTDKINNELRALIVGLWKIHKVSEDWAEPITSRFELMDL